MLFMPRFVFQNKYPDAKKERKKLPVLANNAVLQRTTGANTQPSLLRTKEVAAFRGPCKQDAKITLG